MHLFVATVFMLGSIMPAFAESLDQRIAQLEPHFNVVRPEGLGPFPVVIMLHGCGGPRPFIAEMAQVAARAGAAAIVVDSFAHRGIKRIAAYATVCTGARLRGRERAGDLYAALAWARRQAWADSQRLAAIGWSHGGWTILDALSLRAGPEMARATGLSGLSDEPLAGMSRALVAYPYTGVGTYVGLRDWRFAPHPTAIIAAHDYVVGDSRGALWRQRRRNPSLELVVFENATHAFEDAAASDLRVRYDAEATAREHDLLRAMIAAM